MNSLFLETNRLIIRKHRTSDLKAYSEMQANPKVMEMIPAPVMDFENSTRFLAEILASYEEKQPQKRIWAVELKSTQEFIGNCAIIYLRKDPEIGYRLKEKFWNNGFATEITEALIAYIFSNTKADKIIADCAVENIGSTKVLERFMKNVGTSFNEKEGCQDYHFELSKQHYLQKKERK